MDSDQCLRQQSLPVHVGLFLVESTPGHRHRHPSTIPLSRMAIGLRTWRPRDTALHPEDTA
jgi:hypothetical protein